jgi:hypothetical protein
MRGAAFEGLGLRTRFTLAMLAFVATGLLIVGLSASALFRTHVERIFHAELEEHLVELIGLTEIDATGRPHLSRPLSDPRFGAGNSGYYWQVSRDAGPALRSPSLARASLDDRLAHSEGITHIRAPGPAGPAMVYGVTRKSMDGNDTIHYLVATDIDNLDRLVADFRRDLLIWLAALAVLLLIGAALALQVATRPLDRLATAVAAVRNGSASRMGAPWPAEIAPLATDLDRLQTTAKPWSAPLASNRVILPMACAPRSPCSQTKPKACPINRRAPHCSLNAAASPASSTGISPAPAPPPGRGRYVTPSCPAPWSHC